jgi:hypothetical protein
MQRNAPEKWWTVTTSNCGSRIAGLRSLKASRADLIEKRRKGLRSLGAKRNQHRQIAASRRVSFRNKNRLANNTDQG